MAYLERNFQTEFGSWIREPQNVALFGTANFELKLCKKKSINPKNDFQPHQLPELWNSKHNFVYHKMSDQSMDKKPFDCSLWVGAPAYAVIMFYVKGGPKKFHVIDIDDMMNLIESSDTPYLKESQIAEVSTVYNL